MLGEIRFAGALQEPGACRTGVQHRLSRGEGFGSDDEERRFAFDLAEYCINVVPIDVGDEVKIQPLMREATQRPAHHFWPEIGSADADVDDIGDRLAAIAFPFTRTHALGKCLHLRQHRMHVGIHILPVHDERLALGCAQGSVQYGTLFGRVDLVAGKHRIAPRFHAAFARQAAQECNGLRVEPVLGIVEQQSRCLQ